MWPYVYRPNTQNFTSYENTVPEAETQFELPTSLVNNSLTKPSPIVAIWIRPSYISN